MSSGGRASARQRERDRERGRTAGWPASLRRLAADGWSAGAGVVSRGQQKLLGAAMALAMARYVSERADRPPTLLLDDPAAELDADAHTRLLTAVRRLGGQLIVTALAGRTTIGSGRRTGCFTWNRRQEVKTL